MACTEGTAILESMLPRDKSEVAQTKALGTLKAYAFVTEGNYVGDRLHLDVYRLVHLAMRS